MTLEQLTSAVFVTFNATAANSYNSKEVSVNHETSAGKLTITVSQTRSRSFYGRDAVNVKTQLKLNEKVVAKKALLELLGETTKVKENPVLKAAFLARAPELAESYKRFLMSQFNLLSEIYPEGIECYPSSRNVHYVVIVFTLRDCFKHREEKIGAGRVKYYLQLDEAFLDKKSKEYGEQAALNWFYKTNEKMGDVDNVELGEPGTDMVVIATREGKKIKLSQQSVLKQSKNGVLFHQFPARIYVDRQFVPEAEYIKMFKKQN